MLLARACSSSSGENGAAGKTSVRGQAGRDVVCETQNLGLA